MRLEDAVVKRHLTPRQYMDIRREIHRVAIRFELLPIQELKLRHDDD